jgi:hypothetical protein
VLLLPTGIQNGYDADSAAVVQNWSNGRVEGQVHRLKLVQAPVVRPQPIVSSAPSSAAAPGSASPALTLMVHESAEDQLKNRPKEGPYGSGQDAFYDIPVDVRKSEVTAGIPIRQPTMIEAEQVKNGRMQVVKVYLILDRVVAVVIRGAP